MPLAANADPMPSAVFLKQGFSTILEFEETPTQVVLGDSAAFQVERLGRSMVIKALVPYATTNMFVYFSKLPTKLFVLSASEDAEPTYYRKFESIIPKAKATIPKVKVVVREGANRISTSFPSKKDFLNVEAELRAGDSSKLIPRWNDVRVLYKANAIKPSKVWAERSEVQKNSAVKFRVEFLKPNLPANLKDARLIVPIEGRVKPIAIDLGGRN